MAQRVVELNCPGCGARVSTQQVECEWCHKPVVITSFNSVYTMPTPTVSKYAGAYKQALKETPDDPQLNSSVAMCYLKLKLYDKALEAFERAIEDDFDNSETYFYAAVCLLQGKKAFVNSKKNVDRAIQYINSALMLETRGIYYYFLAYLKYDYYERKSLNISPNFYLELASAVTCRVTQADVQMLFDLLGQTIPQQIQLQFG